jgi:uncharacterized membrane protein YfcA
LLEIVAAFAGSFVAGALGSAVGLVLGTLRLPLILLLSGSPSSAAGTNVAISAAAAASGSAAHVRAGRVSWPVVAWMAPPSVAGAVVGALFGHSVPDAVLLGAAAAAIVWNGVDLLVRPVRPKQRVRPRLALAGGSGFLIGVLGGAIGVILGTLRMPALVRGVGIGLREAAGTNLVVGCALGVFAFAAHAARLEVEWDLLAAGLAGALPGAWLGARITGLVSEDALRRGLGVLMLAVGSALAVEAAFST